MMIILIVIICLCVLIGVIILLIKLDIFNFGNSGFEDKTTNGSVETISFSQGEAKEIMELLEAIDHIDNKY